MSEIVKCIYSLLICNFISCNGNLNPLPVYFFFFLFFLMIFFQGKTTAHTDLSSLSYLNVLRKCGAEDASTHTIYCRTSHCERNLYLCTSPHHARNELSHVSYHRQSKKKHMLWNNASKWMMWLYLWSCIMDICRRCIFLSSSCSERSSLPYLIPLH